MELGAERLRHRFFKIKASKPKDASLKVKLTNAKNVFAKVASLFRGVAFAPVVA